MSSTFSTRRNAIRSYNILWLNLRRGIQDHAASQSSAYGSGWVSCGKLTCTDGARSSVWSAGTRQMDESQLTRQCEETALRFA